MYIAGSPVDICDTVAPPRCKVHAARLVHHDDLITLHPDDGAETCHLAPARWTARFVAEITGFQAPEFSLRRTTLSSLSSVPSRLSSSDISAPFPGHLLSRGPLRCSPVFSFVRFFFCLRGGMTLSLPLPPSVSACFSRTSCEATLSVSILYSDRGMMLLVTCQPRIRVLKYEGIGILFCKCLLLPFTCCFPGEDGISRTRTTARGDSGEQRES